MTVSLLEPRRVPETCGQRWRAGPCAARLARFADLSGWAVTMLSGRLAAENLTAVVTKSALILPYLTVAASLTVCDRYPEEDLMNVEISGVTRRFGRNLAVAGVDVATGPGVFGLLGPNGAGKTTLLRMMATAIPPSAGTLRLLGRDPGSYGPRREIRRRLGYLPQNLGYYPGFTVVELIEYFALLKEMPPARVPAAVAAAVERVDLGGKARAKLRTLSGGMLRRAGIAQAIVNEPALLLLDEPTAGLDPEQRIAFRDLLRDLGQRATVVVSTHLVEDVGAACTEVALMDAGKIVFHGTPAELAARGEGAAAAGGAPLERGYSAVLAESRS